MARAKKPSIPSVSLNDHPALGSIDGRRIYHWSWSPDEQWIVSLEDHIGTIVLRCHELASGRCLVERTFTGTVAAQWWDEKSYWFALTLPNGGPLELRSFSMPTGEELQRYELQTGPHPSKILSTHLRCGALLPMSEFSSTGALVLSLLDYEKQTVLWSKTPQDFTSKPSTNTMFFLGPVDPRDGSMLLYSGAQNAVLVIDREGHERNRVEFASQISPIHLHWGIADEAVLVAAQPPKIPTFYRADFRTQQVTDQQELVLANKKKGGRYAHVRERNGERSLLLYNAGPAAVGVWHYKLDAQELVSIGTFPHREATLLWSERDEFVAHHLEETTYHCHRYRLRDGNEVGRFSLSAPVIPGYFWYEVSPLGRYALTLLDWRDGVGERCRFSWYARDVLEGLS